jgi:hypothetical protein
MILYFSNSARPVLIALHAFKQLQVSHSGGISGTKSLVHFRINLHHPKQFAVGLTATSSSRVDQLQKAGARKGWPFREAIWTFYRLSL